MVLYGKLVACSDRHMSLCACQNPQNCSQSNFVIYKFLKINPVVAGIDGEQTETNKDKGI